MLAPTDYEITEAESGEEALVAIAKQRPDLILMDIQLPIVDGYTARAGLKPILLYPIIAVTSYALSGEEKKARPTVPKPFSPRACERHIRNEAEVRRVQTGRQWQLKPKPNSESAAVIKKAVKREPNPPFTFVTLDG
jgi:two-component system, cell cycle response regulator DivK